MKRIKLLVILVLVSASTVLAQSETNLIIKNEDVEIGGTLLLPDNDSDLPLVILVTGSGAQDRNETIYGFEIFKVIAEELVASGIPSFRFDDRGVGASTGVFNEATLELMASDIEAIMSYFQNDSDVKFRKFSIIGHSQGGMIGAYVAERNPEVAQLILMAAPAVALKEVISEQVSAMQRMSGKSEVEIASLLDFQEKAYAAVYTGEGWDSLKVFYRTILESEIAKLPEAQQTMITDMDAFAEAQFNQQVQAMNTPQMKSLLFYDAGEDIAKLDIPILGIFGEKDVQVTSAQNAETLSSICTSKKLTCTIEIIEGANHLFQKANTGLINEYPFLAKEFMPAFLPLITRWIKQH